MWLNDATVVTAEDKAAQARQERIARAKVTRDQAIEANLTVLDAEWQVDAISRDRMQLSISVAAALGHPPETTVPWRIADNTYRDTTAAELQQVLATYAQRMAVIFQAFSAWEESDSTDEFSL